MKTLLLAAAVLFTAILSTAEARNFAIYGNGKIITGSYAPSRGYGYSTPYYNSPVYQPFYEPPVYQYYYYPVYPTYYPPSNFNHYRGGWGYGW